MKRTSGKLNHPNVPPIQHIDLPEKMSRKRQAAIVVFLAIGLFFIGLGIHMSRVKETGWVEVEANSNAGCSAELSFRYYNDGSDIDFDVLSTKYSELCTRADAIYNEKDPGIEIGGIYMLNSHPNEIVTVEQELYQTLSVLQECDNRVIYLGPVYETYEGLFHCTEDWEAVDYDPLRNDELAQEFADIAAFASDPDAVGLELLDDCQVRLFVSDAYLEYAKANNVHNYLDLSWLKNAAILDDISAGLQKAGYSNGYLQSYEGYGVNLAAAEEAYELSVFDNKTKAAAVGYEAPLYFAFFRGYSLRSVVGDWFFEYSDGSVSGPYIDPADGQPKHALEDLLLFSKETDCLTLAARACPAYVADHFDIENLDCTGLTAVWCEDQKICTAGDPAKILGLAEGYALRES